MASHLSPTPDTAADGARRLPTPFHAVEAWVGAVCTSVLALLLGVPACLATVGGIITADVRMALGAGAFLIAWAWLDARHLYWSWSAVRNGLRPAAPAVALRQRPGPWPLRPIVAAWWLGHFAMAMFFSHVAQDLGNGREPHGVGVLGFGVGFAFIFAYAFAYSFAANGYLLLAVSAVTARREWVDKVWAVRVLIDLALAGAALLLSRT